MSFYTIIGQAVPAFSGIASGLLAKAYTPEIAMLIVSIIIVITLSIVAVFLKHIRALAL
jgi:hypothetical protein